jgi:hypothetical protein
VPLAAVLPLALWPAILGLVLAAIEWAIETRLSTKMHG